MQNQQDFHESYLSTISSSDSGFDSHKLTSQEVSRLYGLETKDGLIGFVSGKRMVMFDRYAYKIAQCGAYLEFVEVPKGLKLVDARFCKVPNCPMCQWRRSLKWRSRFLELLPTIQENYSTHKWLFLTLTIRNCQLDKLRETIKHLNKSFNRLSKTVRFPMVGLVKSVEVTRVWDCYDSFTNEYLGRHGSKLIYPYEQKYKTALRLEPTDEVHPHLHIIGMVKSYYFNKGYYINQEEWSQIWKKALRVDYKPIVNIKLVKCKKSKSLVPKPEEFDKDNNLDNGMISGICETLKYTVKEQDLIGKYCQDDEANSIWLKKITEQLYRLKRVEYRGVLKEIGKELQEAYDDNDLITINKDKEEVEETDLSEVVFSWRKALERYVKVKSYSEVLEDRE